MTQRATLYVAFNADGDLYADSDRDTACDAFVDNVGNVPFRVVEVTLTLPSVEDIQASLEITTQGETVEAEAE